MEMRERNKGFGIPSSIGIYHPAPQKVANSQAALDHLLHQTSDLQPQEEQRVEANQNPDPDPPQVLTATTINPPTVSHTPQEPPPQPPASATTATTSTTVQYRECQKNHAASMGSHIVDGCGEFMPNGEDGTAEALKCAACQCHRNFHRREIEGELHPPHNSHHPHNPTTNNTRRSSFNVPVQASHPPPTMAAAKNHHGFAAFANSPSTGLMPPIMMAFGGTSGAPAESSSEDLNMFHGHQTSGHQSKKRFRTKFSQDQKDRMQEFAERIGWKFQKQDEQEVQQFCHANGVKRQVFKVWMHNNKQAMKKKQL